MIRDILDANSYFELVLKHKNSNKYILVPLDKEPLNKECGAEVGIGLINGIKLLTISLDKNYKMGTMGIKEGEKITLAFEYATKKRLPVLSVVAPGGVRIHEGTPALMQMVKTAAAVKLHSDKGLLYVSVIADPTLGGVSASFASLADIIIAEEGARYGFSGKQIICETTHEQIPDGFQTAEYAKKHGMVDIVTNRSNIKLIIKAVFRLHAKRKMR